jgi:hypothetical protein
MQESKNGGRGAVRWTWNILCRCETRMRCLDGNLKHRERMASTTTILWSSEISVRNDCICFISLSTLFSAPVLRRVVMASVAIARLLSVSRLCKEKIFCEFCDNQMNWIVTSCQPQDQDYKWTQQQHSWRQCAIADARQRNDEWISAIWDKLTECEAWALSIDAEDKTKNNKESNSPEMWDMTDTLQRQH